MTTHETDKGAITAAAKALVEAQERFDSAEASYLNGRADLLELRAANGALTEAHWKLKRAEQAGAEQRTQR